jgi:hypothetical protein
VSLSSLDFHDLIEIHDLQMARCRGGGGPRDPERPERAVAALRSVEGDAFELAVESLAVLALGRPFEGGSWRRALRSARASLGLHGVEMPAAGPSRARLARLAADHGTTRGDLATELKTVAVRPEWMGGS